LRVLQGENVAYTEKYIVNKTLC